MDLTTAEAIASALNRIEADCLGLLAESGQRPIVDITGPMIHKRDFMPRFIEYVMGTLEKRKLVSQHDGQWVCEPLGRAVAACFEREE